VARWISEAMAETEIAAAHEDELPD
jgi:hypothetical protein